ncbi:hypothetical protein [Streptomyces sp. YKOK-I1]
MGPNDAQIVRVFSRRVDGSIADVTLSPGSDAEIQLEAEAGSALFGTQGAYTVTLVVRDISDGTVIPTVGPSVLKGHFQETDWSKLDAVFTFVLDKGVLDAHKGHLARAYGSVVYGSGLGGGTFAVSPYFQILPD